MALARTRLIDQSRPGWYHCISRCVRRAFLCGDRYGHRRQWIEDRLRFLAGCFAVEVSAYAVMSNHVHVVVRMDPRVSAAWDDLEVTRRWMSVYPRSYLSDGTPVLPAEDVLRKQAQDAAWVAVRRTRLGELSWLMKAFKEPIARRANREDDCTGAFWEERFTAVPLLDQPALVACMAYVDLNPVRAKLAPTPEASAFTGVRERARSRNRLRASQRLAIRTAQAATEAARERVERLRARVGLTQPPAHAEDGLWLAPMERCYVGEPLMNRLLKVDDYLTLVDATGKLMKAGKRGAVVATLAPILARLDLQVDAWLATMLGWRQMSGSVLGSHEVRMVEAERRGVKWVRNTCSLFVKNGSAA